LLESISAAFLKLFNDVEAALAKDFSITESAAI